MKKRLIMITTALLALVAPIAGTASATFTGGLTFECTAVLPAFPADSESGVCRGDVLPAAAAGAAAGLTDGEDPQPYTLSGPGTFQATFDYSEGCQFDLPPAAGTAMNGTAVAEVDATVADVRTKANVSATFDWLRVGAVAILTFDPVSITFETGDTASAALPGAAVATFALVPLENQVCPTGGPLKAFVVGTLLGAV